LHGSHQWRGDSLLHYTDSQGRKKSPQSKDCRDGSHPVQQAWMEETFRNAVTAIRAIMSAVALLSKNRNPRMPTSTIHERNICRCGTYQRIRRQFTAPLIYKPAKPSPRKAFLD